MVTHLLGYEMTEHASMRCRQRGVREEDLFAVCYYGCIERTHGQLRYVLTDRALSGTPLEKDAARLRGLAVIVDQRTNKVLTIKHQFSISRRPGKLRGSRLKAMAA